jgi:hypothetical protein
VVAASVTASVGASVGASVKDGVVVSKEVLSGLLQETKVRSKDRVRRMAAKRLFITAVILSYGG